MGQGGAWDPTVQPQVQKLENAHSGDLNIRGQSEAQAEPDSVGIQDEEMQIILQHVQGMEALTSSKVAYTSRCYWYML